LHVLFIEKMIRPTVLNSILCQANAEGVTGTLLMNREGMVLCHAGCDESQAEAIAAIASNIWCSYEKSGQETFRDDKLKWFFLEGSEGRIAICKVSTLLLCMVANDTVEIGMLRGKNFYFLALCGQALLRTVTDSYTSKMIAYLYLFHIVNDV
ncbi:Ragulator complex protein LAMTOR2, partial [Trichinella pseudospiralis]